MTRRIRKEPSLPPALAVLALVALALAGLGWYLLGRGNPPPPPAPTVEWDMPLAPAVRWDEPITPTMEPGPVVAVSGYRLSGPYTHDNLSVFLVHGPATLDATSFLTLQEALERKKAVVHETGSVNQLAIENLGDEEEVYVQSGDIVKGGRQDRTLPYDAVVGPRSGRVPLDSFCVEQGRWTQRGDESPGYFSSSSSSLATSDLKKAAKAPGQASQAEVWRNVARTQERLADKLGGSVRSGSSGSSLQLTLESPAVRSAVGPYLRALGTAPDDQDDAIGYVAVVNGRAVSADVYASPALFRKLWPKLLEGSAVEAFLEAEAGRTFDPAGEDAVHTFLAEAEGGKVCAEAVTARTYVQVRGAGRAMLFESCDRSHGNLVLHRNFLAR
jgi:hypothetical protein